MKKHIQSFIFTVKMIISIHKKLFFIVVFLAVFTSIFPVISLTFTQNILNIIHSLDAPFHEIIMWIAISFTFSIIVSIIQNVYSYFNNQLSVFLMYRMNYLLMDKCSKLSLEQLEETATYEMMSRLEGEISSKPYQALSSLISLLSSSVIFSITLVILFNWKVEIFFLLSAISILSFWLHLKVADREFKMRFNRSSKERKVWYYSFLLTRDTAFKEVKVLNLKYYFLNRYWSLVKAFIESENEINRTQMLINLGLVLLQDASSSIILFLSMRETYLGIILIGTAIFYTSVTSMFQNSISNLASNIYALYNSSLYMLLLKDFLNTKENEKEGGLTIDSVERIEVCDLAYHYPNNYQALQNLNFKIEKGESVAIVGKNGSGKSTLLKLLSGLYEPTDGTIKINGINLTKIDDNSYKKEISVLFQDFLKFEATLLENIQIGDVDREVNKLSIKNALKSANVNFLKNNEDYLYDRFLGNWFEDGSQLSGGEWQKIALARAYYKKASLYILDEPSSALDVIAEMKIFEHFFKRKKNKIGIFITHRVKVARQADKIIVLDQGEIMSVGTHNYLYESCEFYKELFLKEKELDEFNINADN